MLFNSYIFIFVFLPLTLCGYYGLHRLGSPVLAKIELILMSFWFYGYFNPSYLWIMCSSILVNYVLVTAPSEKMGDFREKTSDVEKWSVMRGTVL